MLQIKVDNGTGRSTLRWRVGKSGCFNEFFDAKLSGRGHPYRLLHRYTDSILLTGKRVKAQRFLLAASAWTWRCD